MSHVLTLKMIAMHYNSSCKLLREVFLRRKVLYSDQIHYAIDIVTSVIKDILNKIPPNFESLYLCALFCK